MGKDKGGGVTEASCNTRPLSPSCNASVLFRCTTAGIASCPSFDISKQQQICIAFDGSGCSAATKNWGGQSCATFCSDHGLTCSAAFEPASGRCDAGTPVPCNSPAPAGSDLLCQCTPPSLFLQMSGAEGPHLVIQLGLFSFLLLGNGANTSHFGVRRLKGTKRNT